MENEAEPKVFVTRRNKAVEGLKRRYAIFRFGLINLKHSLGNFWFANKRKTELSIWLVIVVTLIVLTTFLPGNIQPFLKNGLFLETLRATALGLGTALLGSTAIVASLALFAMQVNIERLPHGLFRRLSADSKLLTAFGTAFAASVAISALPLMTPLDMVEWAILACILLIALILRLFLFAYRRALALINPIQQLQIVIEDVSFALGRWRDQANWFTRALPPIQSVTKANRLTDLPVDTRNAAFFLENDWAINVANRGIDQCIAVNGRAALQGDYPVAEQALAALANINMYYVQAKGRTFFAQNSFIETPFASDLVINQSLEQLKRQFRASLGRRDEEHVNMLLKAYGNLIRLYSQIDYGQPETDPWHASLAAGYLIRDVKLIAPQNLPDCMMQGLRILGGSAIALLNRDKTLAIVRIVNEFGPIGAAMSIREDHHAVTITAMEQLAGLTYHMINTGVFNPDYAFDQIRSSVQTIATVALNQPNPALTSVHRSLLAPYFSPTASSSLTSNLKQLANSLLELPTEDEQAGSCIANLHEWAKRTRPLAKELMLLAIEKRSQFVFDIMHWIKNVVEVLLAASNAPASESHFDSALEEQAERWAQALSWIPDDSESLDCAATWSATSVMFDIAGAARKWKSERVYETTQRTLLRWALRPSRHKDAWNDVEEAVIALAATALKSPNDIEGATFKTEFAQALQAEQLPDTELLLKTAEGIKRCIEDYDQGNIGSAGWHQIFKQIDPGQRHQFLTDLANILEAAASK